MPCGLVSCMRKTGPGASELLASRWASLSTPTPRRSTSSPPRQTVTNGRPAPAKVSARASAGGLVVVGAAAQQRTETRLPQLVGT